LRLRARTIAGAEKAVAAPAAALVLRKDRRSISLALSFGVGFGVILFSIFE
jgi:hypothetical protein